MIKEFCLRHCHIFVMCIRENTSEFLNFMQPFADSIHCFESRLEFFMFTKKIYRRDDPKSGLYISIENLYYSQAQS